MSALHGQDILPFFFTLSVIYTAKMAYFVADKESDFQGKLHT
jgi:hypothetical protein